MKFTRMKIYIFNNTMLAGLVGGGYGLGGNTDYSRRYFIQNVQDLTYFTLMIFYIFKFQKSWVSKEEILVYKYGVLYRK